MEKSIHFKQTVHRAIQYNTWLIPQIHNGDGWRNIHNPEAVINARRINGHDKYENAIFRIAEIMKSQGWQTVIIESFERCHEHLQYHHYHLHCWK